MDDGRLVARAGYNGNIVTNPDGTLFHTPDILAVTISGSSLFSASCTFIGTVGTQDYYAKQLGSTDFNGTYYLPVCYPQTYCNNVIAGSSSSSHCYTTSDLCIWCAYFPLDSQVPQYTNSDCTSTLPPPSDGDGVTYLSGNAIYVQAQWAFGFWTVTAWLTSCIGSTVPAAGFLIFYGSTCPYDPYEGGSPCNSSSSSSGVCCFQPNPTSGVINNIAFINWDFVDGTTYCFGGTAEIEFCNMSSSTTSQVSNCYGSSSSSTFPYLSSSSSTSSSSSGMSSSSSVSSSSSSSGGGGGGGGSSSSSSSGIGFPSSSSNCNYPYCVPEGYNGLTNCCDDLCGVVINTGTLTWPTGFFVSITNEPSVYFDNTTGYQICPTTYTFSATIEMTNSLTSGGFIYVWGTTAYTDSNGATGDVSAVCFATEGTTPWVMNIILNPTACTICNSPPISGLSSVNGVVIWSGLNTSGSLNADCRYTAICCADCDSDGNPLPCDTSTALTCACSWCDLCETILE
jgi:uncharacterized membrane protein YgcG